MKTHFAALLIFTAVPLHAAHVPAIVTGIPAGVDFVIDAANRVGALTPFGNEVELIRTYGGAAVTRAYLNFGSESPWLGTVLFQGTDREAFVRWRGNFEAPEWVKISQPATPWITMEGLTVGTSLEEVEAINGRPFVIASCDLNRGALTLSWEDGTFAPELVLDLGPSEKLSSEEMRAIGKRMTHRSSEPAIKKLRYSVRSINVNW